MYGPNLLMDKSIFHALSTREAEYLHRYFNVWPTPILVVEVLGDLGRTVRRGGAPSGAVVEGLSRRFGGSGLPMHRDYTTLLRYSLLGASIPMRGQVIPADQQIVEHEDGEVTIDSGLAPLNAAILRWRIGDFTQWEHDFSKQWQGQTPNLSLSALNDLLNANHVIVPPPGSAESIVVTVDQLLGTMSLQRVWLEYLTSHAGLDTAQRAMVQRRWERSPHQLLSRFAPYANHCMRAALALHASLRHRLLKSDKHHSRDLQYLFYLPFYHVFASNDTLHRLLAPQLLMPNQSFVGLELKVALKSLADNLESMSPDEHAEHRSRYGLEPPADDQSVLTQVWRKWMSPP